jgi:hypothetical protein
MRTTSWLIVGFAVLWVAPLHAQTCGWNSGELEAGLPRTLAAVLARGDPGAEVRAAVDEYLVWVSTCDATRARVASFQLTRFVRRRSPTQQLRALRAIALARGPDIHVAGAEGFLFRPAYVNSNAEKEAARELTAAAHATGWPELAEELAALALATRSQETLRQASTVLWNLAASSGVLFALLTEIELARQDYAAVRAASARMLPEQRGTALRARGVANMVSGDSADIGAAQYLAGLEAAEGAELDRYYEEILPLLTGAEQNAWRDLARDERSAWLRRRWERSAAASALTVAERLAAHHQRVDYALRAYRRQSFYQPTPDWLWDAKTPRPLPVDDRGLVYVRHGEPDLTAVMLQGWTFDRYNAKNGPALHRMAWYYRRLGPTRALLEFDKSPYRPDYYLASPTAACEVSALNWDYSMRLAAFAPARHLDSNASQCKLPYATSAGDTIRRLWSPFELADITRDAVFQNESAARRFRQPIRTLVNAYILGAAAAELTVFTWIEGRSVTPSTDSSEAASYALPLMVTAEHVETDALQRVDTTLHAAAAAPMAGNESIIARTRVGRVSPGSIDVRVAVRNLADTTQGTHLLLRKQHPVAGSNIRLSDIVLAEPDGGSWRLGTHQLSPLPGHQLNQGASFRVYHEVYGLSSAEDLEVEIMVLPQRSRGVIAELHNLIERRQAWVLRFRDVLTPDSDGVARVVRTVQSDLAPGDYSVQVRVTRSSSGAPAESSTHLSVVRR